MLYWFPDHGNTEVVPGQNRFRGDLLQARLWTSAGLPIIRQIRSRTVANCTQQEGNLFSAFLMIRAV